LFRRFRVVHEPTFIVTDARGHILQRIDRIEAGLDHQIALPKAP
jgi:hypothetical protein